MSFMAVAYVPAFLEDRATFIKERANGLYGATAFMVANFLIGLPYLCLSFPPRSFCVYPVYFTILNKPHSSHLVTILNNSILALKFSLWGLRFFYLGHVALSRPPCR